MHLHPIFDLYLIKVSIGNPDDLVESLLGRHPGETRDSEIRTGESPLGSLGSGFRRNDASTENSTFCEWINLD